MLLDDLRSGTPGTITSPTRPTPMKLEEWPTSGTPCGVLHLPESPHGVSSIEDPDLLHQLREHRIHLEALCPTCNLQTDCFATYADHPNDRLYQAGISVGVTDTRTITNVALSEEYEKLQKTFGWGPQEFLECNRNACRPPSYPMMCEKGSWGDWRTPIKPIGDGTVPTPNWVLRGGAPPNPGLACHRPLGLIRPWRSLARHPVG